MSASTVETVPSCGGNDYTFEDYGIEGNGIVHTLTCAVCKCYVEYYVPIEEIGEGVELEEEITE